MPWGRYRIGNVRDGGLVHFLYEWFKDERIHWDTPVQHPVGQPRQHPAAI
jgi:hypothetical protein